LNPAPAVPLPSEVYSDVAHIIMNETEAVILSSLPESDMHTAEGLERVGQTFLDRGGCNVIITLGGRGVFYMSAVSGARGLIGAEKVQVADTTAAGDTFVGAYALEVVNRSFEIEMAVRKANRAAAKTGQRIGAQDSIPWRDELV
jgi:ribokinase